ncbi:TPA: TetR/AcrR family transcriptional regulator, partial [Klebsiella michiganensis]
SLQWIYILEEIIDSGINEGEFSSINASVSARQINALIDGYSSMLILDYSKEKRTAFLNEIYEISFKILGKPF